MNAMSAVRAVRGCRIGGEVDVDREFVLMVGLAAPSRIDSARRDIPALGQRSQDRQLQRSIACLCFTHTWALWGAHKLQEAWPHDCRGHGIGKRDYEEDSCSGNAGQRRRSQLRPLDHRQEQAFACQHREGEVEYSGKANNACLLLVAMHARTWAEGSASAARVTWFASTVKRRVRGERGRTRLV